MSLHISEKGDVTFQLWKHIKCACSLLFFQNWSQVFLFHFTMNHIMEFDQRHLRLLRASSVPIKALEATVLDRLKAHLKSITLGSRYKISSHAKIKIQSLISTFYYIHLESWTNLGVGVLTIHDHPTPP